MDGREMGWRLAALVDVAEKAGLQAILAHE
jgi:hypothetical protein